MQWHFTDPDRGSQDPWFQGTATTRIEDHVYLLSKEYQYVASKKWNRIKFIDVYTVSRVTKRKSTITTGTVYGSTDEHKETRNVSPTRV